MGNKTIDVIPAVLSGSDAGTFNKWANDNQFDVVMPSEQEAYEKYKDKFTSPEEFKSFYNDKVVPYYKASKSEQWVNYDIASLMSRNAGEFWNVNKIGTIAKTLSTEDWKPEITRTLAPGLTIPVSNAQLMAEQTGKYFDINGKQKDIKEHSIFSKLTVLDAKVNPNTGEYYYQEVPISQASSDFRGVFGPTPLTRSADSARGIYNLLPSLISDLGHLAEVGIELGTAFQADEDWSAIKAVRAVQNIGSSLKLKAEEDNLKGVNAYDVANGIGQLAEMVAVGWLTGSTWAAGKLTAEGSKLGLQAYRSGIGQKILTELGENKAIEITSGMAKAAKNASLFTGAISAAGPWKEQARQMGIPDNDAALMYLGIAAITTAVEAGIGPNRFLKVFDKELVGPSMETVAKTYLKEAQAKGLGSIKELFKTDRKAAVQLGLETFKKSMQALSGKIGKLDTIPGGAMISGGLEEGTEEIYESSLHTGLQATYDFIAPFLNEKMKRGLDLKSGDGLFGSNYSDMLNFNPDEFIVGAIAGAVGGGFMGNTKAKNEAAKHITSVFAEQGDGAAKLLKDQINDALNLVKAGKTSWLEQTYVTDQGAIKPNATPLERAQANAEVLMGLVDMVDAVYQNGDMKTLVNEARSEQDLKKRAELMGVIEQMIIPEALLGGTAELVYGQQIADLEKSEDPDKASKIQELQAKIQEAKIKARFKYNAETKKSQLFDSLYNDIQAKYTSDSAFDGNSYANLTPNKNGFGMFDRVLAMEKDASAYNQRIRERNVELAEEINQGDSAIDSFRSKIKDYNFSDEATGRSNALKALDEVNTLLSGAHSEQSRSNVISELKQAFADAGLNETIEGMPEGIIPEGDGFSELQAQLDEISKKTGVQLLPEIGVFDQIGFIAQQEGQAPIDYYGSVDDFITELAGKNAQTLTPEDVDIANSVEKMLDMNEVLASASANVWSKYDSDNKRKKLQSHTEEGIAHTPYTQQQLDELKVKNQARKQAIQEILTEYFKNRVGDVVLSGKMQSAYLQKERDILTTVLSKIGRNDLVDKVEAIVIPKEDVVTDKNIPDLNRAEKEMLEIHVSLWESGDIDKVRAKRFEIFKDIYGTKHGLPNIGLFEYSALNSYTDSYRYDVFKSPEGRGLAAMFTINYLHTLTGVDPRTFYVNYAKTYEADDVRFQNFEQRMTTKSAYAFLHDPDYTWAAQIMGESDHKIYPNVITLRGLARTGKSTEVISRMTKTFAKENGRPANVFIFAPNDDLKALHKEELGSIAKVDFAFTDQIKDFSSFEGYDFVIIDEASLITADRIKSGDVAKIINENSNKPFIFLGDDTQVVGVEQGEIAPNYVPSFSHTIKTPIMTFRYATGNQDIWNVEEKVLKSITTMGARQEVIWPNTVYSEDKKAGVQQLKSSIEVEKEFFQDFELTDVSDRKDMVLIVKDLADRDRILKKAGDLGITKEHVRPIEYSLEIEENTGKVISRPSIQGGRRPRVYIAIDENPADPNNIRAINTAIGRSSGFIAMATKGSSSVGNSIDIRQGDPEKVQEANRIKQTNHDNLMEMLNSVTNGVTPTTETTAIKDIRKVLKEVKENSKAPTETNDNYVVNGVEMPRIHSIMSTKSSENAGSSKVQKGQEEAVLVGHFFDKMIEQMSGVSGDRSSMKQRFKEEASKLHTATIGGNTITASLDISDEDIDRVINAFDNLLNEKLKEGLSSNTLIPQPILHGVENGKPFAGTPDFAWLKNGKLSKIDVKTFQPTNGKINSMTVDSWSEQMGKCELAINHMKLPSNDETFIFAIPVERGTLSNGKVKVKVLGDPELLSIDTAKQWSVRTTETGSQPAAGTTQQPTQQPSTQAPPLVKANLDEDTEPFEGTERSGKYGKVVAQYEKRRSEGSAIMYAQSFYPIIEADVPVGNKEGKEHSLHTKMIGLAMGKLNEAQKANDANLRLTYIPDVTGSNVPFGLKNSEEVAPGTSAIVVTLDIEKNYAIALSMAREFAPFANKTGFTGGSDADLIKHMYKNGYFVLGQIYANKEDYGPSSLLYKDTKLLWEKLAKEGSVSVKQHGQTPSAQKSYSGKTNLEEFVQDLEARKDNGARFIGVNRHIENRDKAFYAHFKVFNIGQHVSMEVNGVDILTENGLHSDIEASIKRLIEGTDTSTYPDKSLAYQAFLQNASWFIESTATKEGKIVPRKIINAAGKDISSEVGSFFKIGKNGYVDLNYTGTRKESKKIAGEKLKAFYDLVKSASVYSEATGKYETAKSNYPFSKNGEKDFFWEPRVNFKNMVIYSKKPAMPRIAVDVTSVFENKPSVQTSQVKDDFASDSMIFSKRDPKPFVRKGADQYVVSTETNIEAEVADINTVDEFDEFGLVKKKRIYMASNSELSDAYGHNSDAVGYFISIVAKRLRYHHPNGMMVQNKANEKIVNYTQAVYETMNKIKSDLSIPSVVYQKRDFINAYKNESWRTNGIIKGIERNWQIEISRHEAIWGKLEEDGTVDEKGKPNISFAGNGLWDKVHDPNKGFSSLTEAEAKIYNAYMLSYDKFFYAAVANIYPGFKPNSKEVQELEIRYDEESDEGKESEWKRNYNNGNLGFDASNTMTKTMVGHVRAMTIDYNGKTRPVPIKKFQFILLQAASAVNGVVPTTGTDNKLNSLYQALWNKYTANPESEDAAVIKSFVQVFGMPYSIRGKSEKEYMETLRGIYRNGSPYSYYDMAFNTGMIADAMRAEKASEESISQLSIRKKLAKQAITHMVNYAFSINLKRIATFVYEDDAFRMKSMGALDKNEVERQMYESLAKHVAYGSNGFYISNKTRETAESFSVKETENGIEFSFKDEQSYFTVDKDGRVSFRKGRETTIFRKLNNFLQLNLHRNFYEAYLRADQIIDGRVVASGKSRIETMIGSMAITLMNAHQIYAIKDIEANIAYSESQFDKRLDSKGEKIVDVAKWNETILKEVNSLKAKKVALEEQLKVTDKLVKKYAKSQQLVSETVKRTVAEKDTESGEIVNTEASEKIYLPSGFVSYIRDMAYMQSSLRSNVNFIRTRNAAGKAISSAGQVSMVSNYLTSSDVGNSFSEAQSSLNSKQWQGIPNNPISTGLINIANPRVNGGVKNDFTGKGYNDMTTNDFVRSALDAWVEGVINEGASQTMTISLTPNGESSEHIFVDVKAMNNARVLNYYTERINGENIKQHYITDEGWNIIGQSVKQLIGRYKGYQQASLERWDKMKASIAQLEEKNFTKTNAIEAFNNLMSIPETGYNEFEFVAEWKRKVSEMNQKDLNSLVAYARLFLYENTDYSVKTDENGNVTSFLPGNDTVRANVDLIIQRNALYEKADAEENPYEKTRLRKEGDNYSKKQPFYTRYSEGKLEEGKYSREALQRAFSNERYQYFRLLKSNATIHPGISKFFTENDRAVYYKKQLVDGKFRMVYNPVYEAHFFMSYITNMSFGDNVHGTLAQFSTILKAGKRMKNLSSTGNALATGDVIPGNISKLRAIVVHDGPQTVLHGDTLVPLRTKDGKASSNRSNGAIFYSPLAYIQIHRAMGSYRGHNGQLTKGPLKPMSIDKPDNIMRLLKHAGFVIDEHELIESPEMMDQFKRMTSKELYDKFVNYRNTLLSPTEVDGQMVESTFTLAEATREALELVVDDIENNPELNKQFVGALVPIDAIKTGIKGVVNWWSDVPQSQSAIRYQEFGLENNEAIDDLVVQEFDLGNYLIQQQASEKVTSPDASFAAQYFETLGGLGEHATEQLGRINDIRATNIYDFWKLIDNMTEEPNKLKDFIRNLALENFSGAEHETLSQYLLSQKSNSISLPNIAPKVREYLRNYTNAKADKARISGMSAIQMPGWMRKTYEFNGTKMGYKDLLRLKELGVITEESFNEMKMNAQPMRAFGQKEDGITTGQIVGPFIHREKLQLPKGITPMQVFGAVQTTNDVKAFIDLRTLRIEDLAALLTTSELSDNYAIEKFIPAEVILGQKKVSSNMLIEYATKVYDFIQNVNKLNTVMLVRTPSGPSSAGWYEMIDWTEREYNMVYVPSDKSDIDSTDFDYDMIGVLSYYPEVDKEGNVSIAYREKEPENVKEHILNTARGYNEMLDIAKQIHFDQRNYSFISEPIRLSAYEQLAEERRDKYKFIIPHNFAGGVEMRKEFTVGKSVVGFEANMQKTLGVLLNAAHFINEKQGLLNVSNDVRDNEISKLFGETNIGRLQNMVNLATDNPNLLALYGLNINSYTSGIYFAMMLNRNNDLWMSPEDTTEAIQKEGINVGSIIEFMNKDHIRNFFQRIDNSRGINSKSQDIILSLMDKIDRMKDSWLSKNQKELTASDVENLLNDEEEGYTDSSLMRFRSELNELKRIKREIEETGVSYSEALGLGSMSEFDEEEEVESKPRTSEEIARAFRQNKAQIDKDIAFVNQQIAMLQSDIYKFAVIERLKDFEALLHYAKQSEALRRVGVIVSFNQGKPTEDKEVYRKYNEVKFILGAELGDFLNGIYGTYDYMRNYNDLSGKELEKAKQVEEEVRSFIDFKVLIDAASQLRAQLYSFHKQIEMEKKAFDDYNPFMEDSMKEILDAQKLDHYKFSNAYFKFSKEHGKFMKDLFYEHEYFMPAQANKGKFDFIQKQNAFLSQVLPDYYYSYGGNYSISNPKMAKMLAVQTIAVVQWLEQQIADPDTGVDVTQAENNFFLANLKTGSNGFLPYIYSDGSMNLDESVKGRLRDGFKAMGNVRITINDQEYNIGDFLKTSLEHYQFIMHGFDISRGSLNQVIQGEVFGEFSAFIEKYGTAYRENGSMIFNGVLRKVSDLSTIEAMQLPLSSKEIVGISRSAADKLSNENKPEYAYTQERNKGVKVFKKTKMGDEYAYVAQYKNIYGPVGNRYSSSISRGGLSNVISLENRAILIYGASMEAYMNLMKGNYATLNFIANDFGLDKIDIDNQRVYVDGIPVNVLEKTSTQLIVKPISQGAVPSYLTNAKFGVDNITGNESDTINC